MKKYEWKVCGKDIRNFKKRKNFWKPNKVFKKYEKKERKAKIKDSLIKGYELPVNHKTDAWNYL